MPHRDLDDVLEEYWGLGLKPVLSQWAGVGYTGVHVRFAQIANNGKTLDTIDGPVGRAAYFVEFAPVNGSPSEYIAVASDFAQVFLGLPKVQSCVLQAVYEINRFYQVASAENAKFFCDVFSAAVEHSSVKRSVRAEAVLKKVVGFFLPLMGIQGCNLLRSLVPRADLIPNQNWVALFDFDCIRDVSSAELIS